MSVRLRIRTAIAGLGIAASLAGCANFQAVSATSGQLVSAASSWDGAADEFQASCHRRNQFTTRISDCVEETAATTGLVATDKILVNYFKALQQVSDSSNLSVDKGLNDLGSSVKAIPGAPTAQVEAATALAVFLADFVTNGVRERALKRLIEQEPNAIATLDILQQVVVPGLKNNLQAEQGQIRAAYGVYARDQVAGPAFLALNDCANPPATNDFPKGDQFLLAVAYCNQITTVKIKLTTLDSYDKSLTSAKALLTDLKNGKDRLTAAETIKLLYEDASTLNDDVNAIRKAF